MSGDNPPPPPSDSSTTNPQKTHWIRQDKLILSAILASTTSIITPFISATHTSQQAWKKLHTMYASKSRTRTMQLKEELTMIKKGNQTVQEYLHTVKALADEISLIDHPLQMMISTCTFSMDWAVIFEKSRHLYEQGKNHSRLRNCMICS